MAPSTKQMPPLANLATVESLPCYNVTEPGDDCRLQTLAKSLEASHRSVAPLRDPDMILHSHMPHILGSAFFIGAPAQQIQNSYDTVINTLKDIDSKQFVRSKDAITRDTFRDCMLKKEYSVAWMDFFDKEFHQAIGDWKTVVESYLFHRAPHHNPLITGLVGGLGHPMIHLHYAYEFGSPQTAAEGLSLLCTEYYPFHDLLERPQRDTSSYKTTSLAEVMDKVRLDPRFHGLLHHKGIANVEIVAEKRQEAVLEHWHAWDVVDPVRQLEHVCDLATMLAISTPDPKDGFDFFLIHLLTIAHAIRHLWPIIPTDYQVTILREFALMAIQTYIGQLRPAFELEAIEQTSINGRNWEWVQSTAISHPAKFDVHFFKVVRAPLVLARAFGDKDGFYLRAALKFLDEFNGFGGFPPAEEGEFDARFEGWQADGKFS